MPNFAHIFLCISYNQPLEEVQDYTDCTRDRRDGLEFLYLGDTFLYVPVADLEGY